MTDMAQEVIEPKRPIAITSDLTTVKVLLWEMVAALQAGPKSREIALVITKLQEARMWASEAQAQV